MNAPFYHPSKIDWQDGLNPLKRDGYGIQANPYVYKALQRPTMVELRHAPGMDVALFTAPTPQFALLNGAATRDDILMVQPGSWLYALTADSQQPEGFVMQITYPDGGRLFDRPMNSNSIGENARQYFLSEPQGFPAGGPVTVRLTNKSAAANECQLVLWIAQP